MFGTLVFSLFFFCSFLYVFVYLNFALVVGCTLKANQIMVKKRRNLKVFFFLIKLIMCHKHFSLFIGEFIQGKCCTVVLCYSLELCTEHSVGVTLELGISIRQTYK